MTDTDEGLPEPILFLLQASDAMEAYKARHGRYPSVWHELDISFAGGPYRVGEAGTEPRPEDGPSWRPKDAEFTYRIEGASDTDYLIRAYDGRGEAVWEMRAGMEDPVKLRKDPEDELCTLEQPMGVDLPEAVIFLNAAARAFNQHRARQGRFADAWDRLDFHWALVPHRPGDPAARPTPGTGRSWRPAGAAYAYVIARADAERFELRSTNDRGLQDYRIASGDREPSPLPP